MTKRWVARVVFRDRSKWLPSTAVTVEGSSITAALGRAVRAAEQKAPGNRPRRVYEVAINLKPLEAEKAKEGT